MNWQTIIQEWLNFERTDGKSWSYRSIADACGVDRNLIWKLGADQLDQPRHDAGEKILLAYRRALHERINLDRNNGHADRN